MANKKEEDEAPAAPQGFVKVLVADGQIVRDVNTKKHVRAGGVVEIPAARYEESMGEIEGAPPPKKRRGRDEGVTDV